MKNYPVSTFKKHFLLCITYCTIFSYINAYAQTAEAEDYQPKPPKNYPEEIAKQYLDSFIEGKKEKKAKRNKEYEIPRPSLFERDVISILLLQVFGKNNKAVEEFLQKRLANGAADMQPTMWKKMHILQGSTNAPDNHLLKACLRSGALSIEKAVMALSLVTPITNVEALKKCQDSTAVLLENRALHMRLKELYGQLQERLPAIISLYDKDLDPMWSIHYQKILQTIYKHENGKFTRLSAVNANQFLQLYIFLPFIGGILGSLLYYGWQAYKHRNSRTYGKVDTDPRRYWIFIIFVSPAAAFALDQCSKRFLMEKTINNYICGRIADVKTLLEVAQEISNTIGSDPRLEALYGDKLTHTRKLLALQHENRAYNETVEIILNNNFKNRGLFFNCISKVLYIMTLLQENIHMLDETLFELGHLGTFLCIADLIQNPDNNQNTFSFVNYFSEEEKADVYIDLKNNWSVSVDPNKAVLNDIFIDGASHNTAVITGSDKCDSTILMKAVFESALLAQTLGIIPGTGSLTPFSLFYVYKDSPNPSLDEFLFEREIDTIKLYKQTLQYYHKHNKKTLTFFDKYLNSTDIAEEKEKHRAFIVDIIQKFPKNANVISTHNSSLIKKLNALDKSVIIQC